MRARRTTALGIRALWAGAFGGVAVAVLVSIWVPWWLHFRVNVESIDDSTIVSLRAAPNDQLLSEIETLTASIRTRIPDASVARQVARLQDGHIDLLNGQTLDVALPFNAEDYHSGHPGSELNMAMLIVADTLLRGAIQQEDASLFRLAKNNIVAFSRFEKSIVGDYGLIRNDHALAARIGLLTQFWRAYRQHPEFNVDEARIVLEQLSRCAALLAKPSHYTAWTNHGVMQNLALLQFAAAFPNLREAAIARQTGYERLRRQMAYFIHPEGAVLEHGPGYHRFGIVLVGMALRLIEMNALPDIPELREHYARGVTLLDRLTRSDGSLPRFGDTNGAISARPRLGPPGLATPVSDVSIGDAEGTSIYPGAGYAISLRTLSTSPAAASLQSHTTVFWSHYPGHGHLVDADTSIALWAAGRNWIGNAGYWPYSDPARDRATGWRGSNAPHLRTELTGQAIPRASGSTLVGQGSDARVSLVDTARPLSGGGTLRRQVLQLDAGRWLILDFASPASQAPIDRLWTLEPDLELVRRSDSEYLATDPHSGWRMLLQVIGPSAPLIELLRGSRDPFGGWVMNGPIPLAAPALVATQSPGVAWLATLVQLLPPAANADDYAAPALQVEAPQHWSMRVHGPGSAPAEITRRDGELIVTSASESHPLAIKPGTSDVVLHTQATIAEALAAEKRAFPRFRPLDEYRRKLSIALAFPALLTTGAGFVVAGWSRTARRWVAMLLVLAWAALAAWIHMVYFSG